MARTLTIDIGGTGIKMITLDGERPINARARELTPRPALPEALLAVCARMIAAQPAFDRVSVGFPGVVVRGVVRTAPNLDTAAWRGHDLKASLSALCSAPPPVIPVQVMNDAELQGFGVIEGRGVELVLTLGTGLGSGLYTDGRLVPNLELGHHPFSKKGKTYEQRICNVERKRIGKRRWARRVLAAINQMRPIFNFDRLYLGGGNAKHLDPKSLHPDTRRFTSVQGLTGGARLWGLDQLNANEG